MNQDTHSGSVHEGGNSSLRNICGLKGEPTSVPGLCFLAPTQNHRAVGTLVGAMADPLEAKLFASSRVCLGTSVA
eukprot:4362603-Alexandrium_andersonii.AAC.1